MRTPMLSASATSASMCYLRQWGTETGLADRSAGRRDWRGARTFGGNSPATLGYEGGSVKIARFLPPRLASSKFLSTAILRRILWSFAWVHLLTFGLLPASARAQGVPADSARVVVLAPDAVWDGTAEAPRRGWVVVVRGQLIEAVGPETSTPAPAGAERMALPGATLIPGLIEGHSHLFLHPYDETLWDDQVLKESYGFRMVEAVAHARATLAAGITTTRDLGTEGAGFADVGLKQAIDQGIVPGP